MSGNKVMIVTGGSRGIGAATALAAAQQGYRVCILYRSGREAAEEVVAAIARAGGQGLAVQADVGDEADVSRAFAVVDGRWGAPSVLVNNAGVTGGVSRVESVTAAQIAETLRVNVTGSFLCAREAVRRMSTRHGGKGGAIVNLSSAAARTGSPNVWVHYAASKGAVDAMTIGLAREVAAEGIRVNAIRAGIIDTEIHASRDPQQFARMIAAVPMRRMGSAGDIADAVLWLASDRASYVTGALLDAAGGV